MQLVLTLSVLRRSFREACSIRRSTFSVQLRRVRRVYLTLEPNLGGIYSHPYPPGGHASTVGRLKSFKGIRAQRLPRRILKNFEPILVPRWPPRSPTCRKSSILDPSWAHLGPNILQHSRQDVQTTPSKRPAPRKSKENMRKIKVFTIPPMCQHGSKMLP